MQPFRTHKGKVAPLDRANVDTDQIIPKQFLKRIERTGFGEFLFYDWRRGKDGLPDPVFLAEPAALQRSQRARGGQEFRLRIVARACGLGPGRFWFPRRDRSVVCRHLCQQLRKEWRAHGRAERKRSRGNRPPRQRATPATSSPSTWNNAKSTTTADSPPASRSTTSPATACSKAWTTSDSRCNTSLKLRPTSLVTRQPQKIV